MEIGRGEFIDEFLKLMKRDLDKVLPLKAEESTMLSNTRIMVNRYIEHIQLSLDGE